MTTSREIVAKIIDRAALVIYISTSTRSEEKTMHSHIALATAHRFSIIVDHSRDSYIRTANVRTPSLIVPTTMK